MNIVVTTTKAKPLLEAALNERAMRQDVIASNIANIDTPHYKARDVDFESALIQKSKEMYGKGDVQELPMAKANGAHLGGYNDNNPYKSTLYLRDGHTARNDANTVDLDVETTEMSKNSAMFNAITAALKKNSTIFKSVLTASGKV